MPIHRRWRVVAITSLLPLHWAAGATITVTPSATTVAVGTSCTFTVVVVPSTAVQSVTLSYEGESGQDQLSAAPYVATHQFNTPMTGLTTTATVQFNDGSPTQTGSVDVNVVGLTITGSTSPLMGWTTSYTVRSNPTGYTLGSCTWTYQNSTHYASTTTAGGSANSWAGRMLVPGTLTVSSTISGVPVTQSLSVVAIGSRNWTTPITCATDNESGWGDEPDGSPEDGLGMHRDRVSNYKEYFFTPRDNSNEFTSAVSLTGVTSGPCTGLWYVSSTTLKCDMETVINKYIKSGGPALGGTTFLEANDNSYCLENTAAFPQAVMNHEYRGTPPTSRSEYGHHGRTERAILDQGKDPRAQIEALVASSRSALESSVNEVISTCESEVGLYVHDEIFLGTAGANWGISETALGLGSYSFWTGSNWSNCGGLPDQF